MRKFISAKSALITLLVVAAASLAFSAISTAKRTAIAPPTAGTNDPRSLHEKARRGGGKFVGNADYNYRVKKTNLNHLVRDSEVIVVATARSNQTKLLSGGKMVTTDYQVQVEEVIKGTVTHGETVTVSLPGGKTGFEDGSTAEVITPWFKKMLNNKRYALFLQKNDSIGTYVTTGGPQGVFEIPAGGEAVISHSGLRDEPMREHQKDKQRDFLMKVRRAVKH